MRARAAAGAGTRRIDLGGRVAIPAFNEAHMHLLPYGLGLSQVNLRAEEVRTLDEVLRRIARRGEGRAEGRLGARAAAMTMRELDVGRHPTASELDRAAPDNPVFIVRTCGHMGVANSAAMTLAGVGHNTPDPEGGVIERKGGALTGLFQERAHAPGARRDPAAGRGARWWMRSSAACAHLASLGFASATDMNVGMTAGMAEVAAYDAREGRRPAAAAHVAGAGRQPRRHRGTRPGRPACGRWRATTACAGAR